MERFESVFVSIGAMLALVACATELQAAAPKSEESIRALAYSFCDAWNKHDGHALAAIVSEDIDFVNVGARWFRGRSDFETYHTRLLSGRFSEARMEALEMKVRFLRDDLAALHWTWSMSGDKNFDGTARPKRHGLMTVLAERRGGHWKIALAQNTNLMSGPAAPEEEGIASPVTIPDEQ